MCFVQLRSKSSTIQTLSPLRDVLCDSQQTKMPKLGLPKACRIQKFEIFWSNWRARKKIMKGLVILQPITWETVIRTSADTMKETSCCHILIIFLWPQRCKKQDYSGGRFNQKRFYTEVNFGYVWSKPHTNVALYNLLLLFMNSISCMGALRIMKWQRWLYEVARILYKISV